MYHHPGGHRPLSPGTQDTPTPPSITCTPIGQALGKVRLLILWGLLSGSRLRTVMAQMASLGETPFPPEPLPSGVPSVVTVTEQTLAKERRAGVKGMHHVPNTVPHASLMSMPLILMATLRVGASLLILVLLMGTLKSQENCLRSHVAIWPQAVWLQSPSKLLTILFLGLSRVGLG